MPRKKIWISFSAIFFIIILIIAIGIPIFIFINIDLKKPKGIRITIDGELKNTLIISWYTDSLASNPILEYSFSPDLLKFNVSHPLVLESGNSFVYKTKLNNLTYNTTYYYRISSNEYNGRELMKFTTLPEKSPKEFTFLIYGDTRTQKEERRIIAKKIRENFINEFDFMIHLGDIAYDGTDQDQLNSYFTDTEYLNAFKPCLFVEGNHEGGIETKMYKNLFYDNLDYYYSFNYSKIGFLILNTNYRFVSNSQQTKWLNETLYNSSKNALNFAFMHHPLLHERSDPYFRENWRSLFEYYNNTHIFGAHNHQYERSYPIIDEENLLFNNSEMYDYKNLRDPIYFITAGAGAPLYDLRNDGFIAKNKKAYHFCLANIKRNEQETIFSLEAWEVPISDEIPFLFDNMTIKMENSI
jgi:predicted phosphodiesterase